MFEFVVCVCGGGGSTSDHELLFVSTLLMCCAEEMSQEGFQRSKIYSPRSWSSHCVDSPSRHVTPLYHMTRRDSDHLLRRWPAARKNNIESRSLGQIPFETVTKFNWSPFFLWHFYSTREKSLEISFCSPLPFVSWTFLVQKSEKRRRTFCGNFTDCAESEPIHIHYIMTNIHLHLVSWCLECPWFQFMSLKSFVATQSDQLQCNELKQLNANCSRYVKNVVGQLAIANSIRTAASSAETLWANSTKTCHWRVGVLISAASILSMSVTEESDFCCSCQVKFDIWRENEKGKKGRTRRGVQMGFAAQYRWYCRLWTA